MQLAKNSLSSQSSSADHKLLWVRPKKPVSAQQEMGTAALSPKSRPSGCSVSCEDVWPGMLMPSNSLSWQWGVSCALRRQPGTIGAVLWTWGLLWAPQGLCTLPCAPRNAAKSAWVAWSQLVGASLTQQPRRSQPLQSHFHWHLQSVKHSRSQMRSMYQTPSYGEEMTDNLGRSTHSDWRWGSLSEGSSCALCTAAQGI